MALLFNVSGPIVNEAAYVNMRLDVLLGIVIQNWQPAMQFSNLKASGFARQTTRYKALTIKNPFRGIGLKKYVSD